MAKITINGISVDPIADETVPSVSPLLDLSTSDYILIQTNPSLNDDRRVELAELGVTILEYVPQYSYLCHYANKDLQAIRALGYIAWADVYPIGFKLTPNLLSPGSTTNESRIRSLKELMAKPESSFKLESKEVDIVLHGKVNVSLVRQKLATAARIEPQDLNVCRHKARITLQARYLPEVAAVDEVRHVEEVLSAQLLNDVARGILRLGTPDGDTPFEGEGQIVVVADSGFDIGKTDKVHSAFMDNDKETPKSRVIKIYALGRPENPDDPIGHGTHVAGSVLGDGISEDGNKIRGTAPKARLIVQALHGPQGFQTGMPADLRELFHQPYHEDGARIHNNSWGSRPGRGQYDQQSFAVDDFVWNHRDFVVCFAAGNEGSDSQGTGKVGSRSITSPGTAKNCITVGATENNRPTLPQTYGDKFSSDFPADPIASRRMADNPERVAAISSRGLTQDDRFKPDVVAPGTFILSALSRHREPSGDFGWKEGDLQYIFNGGTSMASPLVAGCVALVREFLSKVHHLNNPSAALVKALLINGANPLAKQSAGAGFSDIPNSEEGFGRVDMAATVGPFAASESMTFKDEAAALKEAQEELTKITINAPTALLKVTLVWTDPPGEHLQNDLDLIVKTANGKERHGNMDPTSTNFDRANNVEQIVWNGIPAGEVEIIVRAVRIATPSLPQPYALVVRTA